MGITPVVGQPVTAYSLVTALQARTAGVWYGLGEWPDILIAGLRVDNTMLTTPPPALNVELEAPTFDPYQISSTQLTLIHDGGNYKEYASTMGPARLSFYPYWDIVYFSQIHKRQSLPTCNFVTTFDAGSLVALPDVHHYYILTYFKRAGMTYDEAVPWPQLRTNTALS